MFWDVPCATSFRLSYLLWSLRENICCSYYSFSIVICLLICFCLFEIFMDHFSSLPLDFSYLLLPSFCSLIFPFCFHGYIIYLLIRRFGWVEILTRVLSVASILDLSALAKENSSGSGHGFLLLYFSFLYRSPHFFSGPTPEISPSLLGLMLSSALNVISRMYSGFFPGHLCYLGSPPLTAQKPLLFIFLWGICSL